MARSFQELLTELIRETPRYPELAPMLRTYPMVRAAESRTPFWVVWRAGGVDVDATLKLLGLLGNPAFRTTRMFEGAEVVSLARVCGFDTLGVVHPNLLQAIIGPDDAGVDYASAKPPRLRAFIWAHATGHPAWTASIDNWTLADVISLDQLPQRWQRMVDDFERAAREQGIPEFSIEATEVTMALIAHWRRQSGVESTDSGIVGPGGQGSKFVIGGLGGAQNVQIGDGNTMHTHW